MFRSRPNKILKLWRKIDFVLLTIVAILSLVGFFFIFGTGRQLGGDFTNFWQRHLLFIALGIASFLIIISFDYRKLSHCAWIFYSVATAVLFYVLFFGVTINDASRWLDLPFFFIRLRLQPAELTKPIAVLFFAWVASRRIMNFNRLWVVILYGLAILPPAVLIAMQPDLGTAMVFVGMGVCIAFVAGLSWRLIAVFTAILLITLPLAYNLALEDYQRQRLQTLVNPSEDVSAAGWNAHQAMLAVGSGGTFGKGYMRGTQHVLGYLPRTVAPTDFIFSVIGEETGFVGAGALVCAFLALLICCLRAAARAPDEFGKLICSGVAAMLFIHVYINIGMSVYMAPIVGLPLPLISYGGSSILNIFISVGLVQSVYIRRDTPPPA